MTPRLSPSLLALQPPEVRARFGSLDARALHARQGRAAKRSGDTGEAWVHADLDAALRAGRLAWWRAVGCATRHARIAGVVQLVAVGVGPCDVVAQTTTGRAVVIEVKRGAKLWRSKAEAGARRDPSLAEHQAAQLEACADHRGLALVAVELAGVKRWLRWGEIPWRADGSLRPGDIEDAPRTLAAAMEDL